MGEKNSTICSYLENPEIFADFINGSLFNGEKVICPETLKKHPITGSEYHSDRTGRKRKYKGERDVIKRWVKSKQYAILAVENQNEINITMPLRNMEYDTEEYLRQLRILKRRNKHARELTTGTEYLSGLKSTDRLKPVVTVVFYHGAGSWDTCKELHDMLDFSCENEKLKKYTPNYIIPVFSIQEMDETKYETGLRELIGIMKHRNNPEQLKLYCTENSERLKCLDDDTFDTISTMIDSKELAEIKEENRTEEGKLDMCKAMDYWRNELLNEGMIQGEARGEARGITKITTLMARLYADGRTEDVRLISTDSAVLENLLKEYGLDVNSD